MCLLTTSMYHKNYDVGMTLKLESESRDHVFSMQFEDFQKHLCDITSFQCEKCNFQTMIIVFCACARIQLSAFVLGITSNASMIDHYQRVEMTNITLLFTYCSSIKGVLLQNTLTRKNTTFKRIKLFTKFGTMSSCQFHFVLITSP